MIKLRNAISSALRKTALGIAFVLAIAAVWLSARSRTVTDWAAVWVGERMCYVSSHDRHVEWWFIKTDPTMRPRRAVRLDKTSTDVYEIEVAAQLSGLTRDWHWGGFRYAEGPINNWRAKRDAATLWLPTWTLSLPAAWITLQWFRTRMSRGVRLERGECVECGYDLRGNRSSGVCAECGASHA